MSRRSTLKVFMSSTLCTVGISVLTTSAKAQDAPPGAQSPVQAVQAPTTAGDIIVTAQRREQRLQDVPISVAVTTGDAIQKAGSTDLLDLSTRMPGVHISGGPISSNITIRGVGSGSNAGFEQSVGTFVDGVYRARSRTLQAGLFDVERVEVLNGPQTTFFGNNTDAGAINITTKKPTQRFEYDATTLYAPTDGQYIAKVGVSTPLTGTLAVRVAGQLTGMNGYIHDSYLNQDGPHMRDENGRIAFHWTPAPVLTSDLRVDYARNRDEGNSYFEIEGCPPPAGFPSATGPCAAYLSLRGPNIDNQLNFKADTGPSDYRLDMTEVAWTNKLDLGGATLTSISSYNHSNANTFTQVTPLPITGVAGYFYSPFRQAERYSVYAQELRLEGKLTRWLSFVAGGYYSHGHLVSNSYSSLFGSTAPGNAGAPVTNATTPIGSNRNLFQTDQTRSIFGQLSFEVSPRLRLNAGLRYTSVLKDGARSAFAGIAGPDAEASEFVIPDPVTLAKLDKVAGVNNLPFADPHKTYDKLMPSASIQYDLTPQITTYFSYTKGFKAGGFSDGNTPSQFGSESVDAYEVGVKGSLLDRHLFFTLDAYESDYTGLQQAISIIGPTGVTVTSIGNAALSVSRGFEGSLTVRASDIFSINASASYIDSHFSSYKGAGCTEAQIVKVGSNCIQDLSGRPQPFAPKLSGTAGFTLALPAGSNEIRVEPDIFYSGSYFLTPVDDPLVKQKSYTMADLRVGFGPHGKRWEVAVIAKNLNDSKVKTLANTLGTAPGLTFNYLQRARSVALQASIKY
jgi:iron complex outermembrane receptor protein